MNKLDWSITILMTFIFIIGIGLGMMLNIVKHEGPHSECHRNFQALEDELHECNLSWGECERKLEQRE